MSKIKVVCLNPSPKYLQDKLVDIAENIEDLDTEFNHAIDEHFWELVSPQETERLPRIHGDGFTDDTKALQARIDKAQESDTK